MKSLIPGIVHHFPALNHRHFRAFFVAQFFSLIGTWMQSITIPWLVSEQTKGTFMLGVVTALSTLPILLFTIFAGVFADKHSKRTIVIITQSFLTLQAATYAVLSMFHLVTIGPIIGLGMFAGLLMAFDMPTRQAFMREMVSRESLPSAIALNSGIFNAARFIGPAVAGMALAQWGPTSCFALNALSFLGIIFVLMRMKIEPIVHKHPGTGLDHLKAGLRYCSRHKTMRSVLTLVGVCSLFGWPYVTILPVITKDFYTLDENAKAQAYGLLVSASGVGAVLGALAVALFSKRGWLPRMIFTGWPVFIVGLVGLAISNIYWVGLVTMFAVGLGLVTLHTSSNALIQSIVPDHIRGRIMGLYSFLFIGMMPFGNFFIGSTAHYAGAQVTHVIKFLIDILRLGKFVSGPLPEISGSRVALVINAMVCLVAVLLLRRRILTARQVADDGDGIIQPDDDAAN